MSITSEAKNEWSLSTSKLLHHCIKLGASDVINDQISMIASINEDMNRDLKNLQIRQYCDLTLEVYATQDIKKGTRISVTMSKYVNDISVNLNLPESFDTMQSSDIAKWFADIKAKSDIEHVLLRDTKTGKYSMYARLSRDISKGQRIIMVDNLEAWIVLKYLRYQANPTARLTPDRIEKLESICIEQIGNSLKRASIIYAIFVQSPESI